MIYLELRIRTLTPLWTGDIDRKCTKIKETGIIGSLRWWYEALVRGLGGYACDPTSEERCELKQDKFKGSIKSGKTVQEALDEQICPACQMFGSTGWRKKFRLEIDELKKEDFVGGRGEKAGLKAGSEFNLNFAFLSELTPEERWLFKKTLWVIENFGAVGGRTTWKPNGPWSTDYGLIEIDDYSEMEEWDTFSNIEQVKKWLEENREKLKKLSKKNNSNWFNFKFYWIVEDKYLNREQINKIVKRDPNNPERYLTKDEFDKWLGGEKGTTKKIFSFRNPRKVFGYVRTSDEMKEMRRRLEKELGSSLTFRTGEEILEELK